MMPTLSVLVTVLNDRAGMEKLLAALSAQTRAPDQVVLVDAHSKDGTWDAIQAFAKLAPFEVVADQRAGSRGVGRARCVELATGELLAFVDADCTVPKDWIARWHEGWAHESAADPMPLGGLGGASVKPDDATPFQQAVDDVMGVMEGDSFHGLNTANACYLREALLSAGAFDASLHTAEDPELNARIAKLGYRLLRIDNPIPQGRRATWRALIRQHYEYGRGAVALLKRHPEYFPWHEHYIAPAGAIAVLVWLLAGVLLSPVWLLVIPAGLILAPLVTHRSLAWRFMKRFGFSLETLRRLGVLWVVYVPYQWGILIGRLGR